MIPVSFSIAETQEAQNQVYSLTVVKTSYHQEEMMAIPKKIIEMGLIEVKPKKNFEASIAEDDAYKLARLLKAVADPTRITILNLLAMYGGEMCVFEIVEQFTLEQPTISHHLRILKDAGLVDSRKKGLWAYYYLERDTLAKIPIGLANAIPNPNK